MLDVNGDIQLSSAQVPMGLNAEVVGTTNPVLNFGINFRGVRNTAYRGVAFRIDSRSDYQSFQ